MLQEVALLNRTAIEFLRVGRHEDAIDGFNKAMHLVHQNSVRDFEMDVRRACEKASGVGSPPVTEVAATGIPLPVLPPDANDTLFEVYTRPFLMNDWFVIPPSVLHITLSFNIGLVYHRLGLSNNRLDDLKMAVRYYEYGLNLVKQNARERFSSTGMYWLTLALLTNAGNILWSLWCTKEAMECRDRVHLLLGTKLIFVLPPEDIEFFLDVSSNGIFCSRNIAPAA